MAKVRVYIAGPISKGDLLHNIQQADAAFEKLARAGFAPWNPMWSVFSGSVYEDCDPRYAGTVVLAAATRTGGFDLPHSTWLDMDLSWVECADAVLRLPGESSGADQETAHAESFGIPVYTDVDTLIGAFK